MRRGKLGQRPEVTLKKKPPPSSIGISDGCHVFEFIKCMNMRRFRDERGRRSGLR
ncbi:MAG: hypothetical protein M1442_00860 [Candidatus Thermoplasmatota archaeon]|nr:hypothetical protein [Candidatus Thermoplasmatota archaeon]